MADLDVLHRRIALARATGQKVTMTADEAEGYEWWLWHLHRTRQAAYRNLLQIPRWVRWLYRVRW